MPCHAMQCHAMRLIDRIDHACLPIYSPLPSDLLAKLTSYFTAMLRRCEISCDSSANHDASCGAGETRHGCGKPFLQHISIPLPLFSYCLLCLCRMPLTIPCLMARARASLSWFFFLIPPFLLRSLPVYIFYTIYLFICLCLFLQ